MIKLIGINNPYNRPVITKRQVKKSCDNSEIKFQQNHNSFYYKDLISFSGQPKTPKETIATLLEQSKEKIISAETTLYGV